MGVERERDRERERVREREIERESEREREEGRISDLTFFRLQVCTAAERYG